MYLWLVFPGILSLQLWKDLPLLNSSYSSSVFCGTSSNSSSCSSSSSWVGSRVVKMVCCQGLREVFSLMFPSFLSSSNLVKVVLVLGSCPLDLSTWVLWMMPFLCPLGLFSLVVAEGLLVKLGAWTWAL